VPADQQQGQPDIHAKQPGVVGPASTVSMVSAASASSTPYAPASVSYSEEFFFRFLRSPGNRRAGR
jgi:hypothetical protein